MFVNYQKKNLTVLIPVEKSEKKVVKCLILDALKICFDRHKIANRVIDEFSVQYPICEVFYFESTMEPGDFVQSHLSTRSLGLEYGGIHVVGYICPFTIPIEQIRNLQTLLTEEKNLLAESNKKKTYSY